MADSIQKIYWDSCVFVDWIQNSDADKIAVLTPMIQAAQNGELFIVGSAVALAEVIRCNGDTPMSDEEDERIKTFFLHPFVKIVPLDRPLAHEARAISRECLKINKKVTPNDAIHIASAIFAGCTTLHTYDDKHLIRVNKLFGDPKLPIELPSYVAPPKKIEKTKDEMRGQSTLFSSLGNEIEEAVFEHKRLQSSERDGTSNISGDGAPPDAGATSRSQEAEAAEGEAGAQT